MAIFSKRHTFESCRIVFLQGSVHLVFRTIANTNILPTVVQRIVVDVVNLPFISIIESCKESMEVNFSTTPSFSIVKGFSPDGVE